MPRINAPAPRRTGQARERRQSHAGVPALAASDGARARTRAEVQRDDVDVVARLAQELGCRTRDEGVADAVEAVLAQTVVAGDLLVDGVGADVLGDGGMELTVEAGHIARRGQRLDAQLDDAQAVGVVERGQVVEIFEVMVGAIGYQLRLGVVAAVDDAVADDADVVFVLDVGHLVVPDEGVEDETEGIPLAADLTVNFAILEDGPVTPLVFERRRGGRQAVHLGLGDPYGRLSLLGAVDGDLHRRGAGIDRQDDCLFYQGLHFALAKSMVSRGS